jgi:outer membrane murein-binding lipoprotein Lpp
MNNLYDLAEQYKTLVDFAEEEDVDISETLLGIAETLDQRMESLVLTVRTLEAQSDILESEITRLKGKKQAVENHVGRIKTYTMELMEASGRTKAGGTLGSVSIQNSPMSLVVDDQNLIPEDYIKVSLSMQLSELPTELSAHPSLKLSVDKKSILDLARHDDFEISGTHVERNQHLRLR